MSRYEVFFKQSARKELEALEPASRHRVWAVVVALSSEPRPAGCKKLRGSKDLWRIRVGRYRVVYSIEDSVLEIEVIAVRHRSQAYR